MPDLLFNLLVFILVCLNMVLIVDHGESHVEKEDEKTASPSKVCLASARQRASDLVVAASCLSQVSLLQSHHSRDSTWLRRIALAMWKSKDPWRCLNCSKLNRFNINCCGDCGGHWEDFMDYATESTRSESRSADAESTSTWFSTASIAEGIGEKLS